MPALVTSHIAKCPTTHKAILVPRFKFRATVRFHKPKNRILISDYEEDEQKPATNALIGRMAGDSKMKMQ